MKKALKIILSILGIVALGFVILYFLVRQGIIPINIFPNARTLYTGYVEIEPISLIDIKLRLEEKGCRMLGLKNEPLSQKGEQQNRCLYKDAVVPFDKENGLVIMTYGQGWGPTAFYLTENKLWDTKDIQGSPQIDKFKEGVGKDIGAIGNIVQIKENSWKITDIKYPWNAIY